MDNKNIIPENQFYFRHQHDTSEQCHRIVNVVENALERKQYCSAVFLDVKQAFDRVRHPGLLFRLKLLLPAPFYLVLKSYLSDCYFYVKINNSVSDICEIKAVIPQTSVLGPVLYTIYTSDMPVTVATYADVTALIANNDCPTEASNVIQNYLNSIAKYGLKYGIHICVNPNISVQITFALRKGDCPSIFRKGEQIPNSNCVKYLGIHLDRRLTWKDQIKSKKEQLNRKTKCMYWLLGKKSELSL